MGELRIRCSDCGEIIKTNYEHQIEDCIFCHGNNLFIVLKT